MEYKEIIKKLDLLPSIYEINGISLEIKKITDHLNTIIRKNNISAEIFVGGSFAKKTVLKSKIYDVDIFIRFDKKYIDLSKELDKIVKTLSKKIRKKYLKVHGSRDYFRIFYDESTVIEVIPVLKIRNPKEARNVTDLSYFHVSYIKNNLKNDKMIKEVLSTKAFMKAHELYGAESYIRGFSGYGIECLIVHYKTFEKMAKAMVAGERIIDPARWYKNKEEIKLSLSESKIGGPLILIDPTWKERNTLASVSEESYDKVVLALKKFLNNPSKNMFIERDFNPMIIKKYAKNKNAQYVSLDISTNKQKGDIAGTKLKKFSLFVEKETYMFFEILFSKFIYDEDKKATYYLVARPKEVVRRGPPSYMKNHCISFRKQNKIVFEKEGVLYSKINYEHSLEKFLKKWALKNRQKLKGMDITKILIN